METLRRTIHPEIRVIDSRKGICEYVASDETVDSYREVIRAAGWKFDHFKKNAPFVDSHDYGSLEKLVGKVIDFEVRGKRLIETVQWAKDVEENKLAQLGWKMTEAGYLRAVSVGFWPERTVRPEDTDWGKQLKGLGLPNDARVRCIYTEQQQIELSVCIIGANPNALAKAHTAGVLSFDEMDFLRRPRGATGEPAGSRRSQRAIDDMVTALRRGALKEAADRVTRAFHNF